MTRDETLNVISMILSHWRVDDWDEPEIEAFSRSILYLDAEIATSTVIIASKELKYPPRIAEFHELYRTEKRRLRAELGPLPEPEGQPIPFWVKRWICARMLYKTFGKEKDLRRFKEAGDHGDLTQDLMPEGAWDEEANTLDDEEAVRRWKQAIRS